MTIEIPDEERQVNNPTDADVIDAIRNLTWNEEKDGCVDLNRERLSYLQVIVTPTGNFHLEYQEKDIHHHWRSSGFVDLNTALQVAVSYKNNTALWRELLTWVSKDTQSLELKRSPPSKRWSAITKFFRG